MLLIRSSNQPDSFSAKFRWVGRVCSWQCSPFRALFSVLNSPRYRRKSTLQREAEELKEQNANLRRLNGLTIRILEEAGLLPDNVEATKDEAGNPTGGLTYKLRGTANIKLNA